MKFLNRLKDFFDLDMRQKEEISRNVLKGMYNKHVGTNMTIEHFDMVVNESIRRYKVTDPRLSIAVSKEWNTLRSRAIKINWDVLKDKYK